MKVLLATDGSDDARVAATWLTESPLFQDATVMILTVAVLPEPYVEVQTLGTLRDSILNDARRVGEEAQKLLAPRWPDAEVRVSEGDPREEIVRVAEKGQADLIVVGARGLGAVRGLFLGSVALAVARHASCAVLVVKGRRDRKSAVLAMDGSEDSFRALRFFASLAEGRRLKVQLVGVLEQLRFPSSAPRVLRARLRAELAELRRERRAQMAKVLERAAAELEGKVAAIARSIPEGVPSEEIVGAADQQRAGLIVLGARGFGPVKRLLLGSVSEKVLRSARCGVLIVKR